MWSTVLGAVAGGLGGFMMPIVAQRLILFTQARVEVILMLAAALTPAGLHGVDARMIALAFTTMIGAALGATLGRVTRRLLRIGPRLLFFSILMPVLWILVHALVLTRLTATGSRLPVWPFVVASIGYGSCIAVVRPSMRTRIAPLAR